MVGSDSADATDAGAGHAGGALMARRLRADARRSVNALLDAAERVFASSGVDAPVREIAAEAGVGMGTLYRRFPTRADLIAAVFEREMGACVAEAAALARDHPPDQALTLWLHRYVAFLEAKKGLAAALHSGDPAYEALPGRFRASFEPTLAGLLRAAADAGDVRPNFDAYDLLRGIGNLAAAGGEDGPEHVRRMLSLLLAGMRQPAPRL